MGFHLKYLGLDQYNRQKISLFNWFNFSKLSNAQILIENLIFPYVISHFWSVVNWNVFVGLLFLLYCYTMKAPGPILHGPHFILKLFLKWFLWWYYCSVCLVIMLMMVTWFCQTCSTTSGDGDENGDVSHMQVDDPSTLGNLVAFCFTHPPISPRLM